MVIKMLSIEWVRRLFRLPTPASRQIPPTTPAPITFSVSFLNKYHRPDMKFDCTDALFTGEKAVDPNAGQNIGSLTKLVNKLISENTFEH